MVCITNIQDGQIFQQTNGKADIYVEGYVTEVDEKFDKEWNSPVWITLYREHDSTMVCRSVKAEQDKNHRFSAVLPQIPAGGPYTLLCQFGGEHVRGDWGMRGEARYGLGVGDIFIISGQSNASGYGKTPGTDMPDPLVHLFDNSYRWRKAVHPMNDSTNSVHLANSEGALSGSSPFVKFGSVMRQALHYPIGLVQTAKGGARLLEWLPKDYPNQASDSAKWEPYKGLLMDILLDAITAVGGKIAGVLWYQGCSATDEDWYTDMYPAHFAMVVERIRSFTGNPDLPFYTVQLNKVFQSQYEEGIEERWAKVKEYQRRAAEMPHVYVTPSHDMMMSDGIHNNTISNAVIGERMAWCALGEEYHMNYFGKAPDVRSAVWEEDHVRIHMDNVYEYLISVDYDANDFHFHDGEETFAAAGYTVDTDSFIVTLPEGKSFRPGMTVSFAPYPTQLSPQLPFERSTGMPPLAFYKCPITAE